MFNPVIAESYEEILRSVPEPSPRCLMEVENQGFSLLQRAMMIRSVIWNQGMSNIVVPMDVATQAFEKMLFLPLPDLDKDASVASPDAPGGTE